MKTIVSSDITSKRGEVFTRPEIVDYMLATIQHICQKKGWSQLRLLEPSCGRGAFIIPLIDALINEVQNWDAPFLPSFLCACDISLDNIAFVREMLGRRLEMAGCPLKRKEDLLNTWLICDDFLTHEFNSTFDVIVGNPPYIRFDDFSKAKQQEYTRNYFSFSNRCDIYIPFLRSHCLCCLPLEFFHSFVQIVSQGTDMGKNYGN